MNPKNIIRYLIGLFVSAILLQTAFTALYPIEPMEYRLVEQGTGGWYVAPIIARLIIGLLFLVPALLITNMNPFKLVTRLGTVVLFVLLFDSGWQLVYPDPIIKICYSCVLPSNPTLSLAAVVLLVLWMVFYQVKQPACDIRWRWVKYPIILGVLALPFILNPIYPQDMQDQAKTTAEDFDTSLLPVDPGSQPVLVGFMSTACRFCKEQARKISVARSKDPDFPQFQVLFLGTEKGVHIFKNAAQVDFPHSIPDQETFVELSGQAYPVFAYVRDGKIEKRWTGHSFNFWAVNNPDKW
jgi:hypothetical protein